MNHSHEYVTSQQADTRYAAIYARVSTEDQGKGFSIPTQIEACQKLAQHEGYVVPETHVLIDEGISGTIMDRPGLRKLRELVNTKVIATAIIYDPDRLSRNLGHQLLLAEEFDKAGVKLLIVSHPMEQGPEGWLFFQMRGALAEYERAKILERLKRGLIGRAKAGHFSGGNVSLGYRYIRGHKSGRFEVDEEEAAIVRRIFAMCLSGMSTRAIARQLTAERVPTQRDRRQRHTKRLGRGVWTASSLAALLRNETYIGRWYYNRSQRAHSHTRPDKKTTHKPRDASEWILVPVPALIDERTFSAAQAQLARNAALSPRRRKHEYLFLGQQLRCGRCGRGMGGFMTRKGRRRYRCRGLAWQAEPGQHCGRSVSADILEAQAWQVIEGVLQNPALVAAEQARTQKRVEQQAMVIERE